MYHFEINNGNGKQIMITDSLCTGQAEVRDRLKGEENTKEISDEALG